ncbi:MOSC N-terminal beta barrel [Penicillium hispanicum]|uniref:MOSC N-terminal beta barrel n=1 Tax=Penicillium hispanicum TaxID=1080232 RepID=UPI00254102D1|nr:MOSC N-terminal beta barrel [Penicillium hispanicum]KAJ5577503.1 MOSC N-terminal beta barrel [Penicillium hispanicum]
MSRLQDGALKDSGILGLLLTILIFCFPLVILRQSLFHSHPRPKGCRRLGLPSGQSNLHDEFDSKYSEGVPSTQKDGDQPSWRVKALFTYPLKSCGGIELQKSDVVPTGLKYDRSFVFAQNGPEGWNCRTLRNAGFQRLAMIHPEIWVPDPSAPDFDPSLPEIQSQGVMVISYPRLPPATQLGRLFKIGMALGILKSRSSFRVPLYPPKDNIYPLVPVKIWKDKPLAHDYGSLLPASLHAYLGFSPTASPLTLFRASLQHNREIFRNAPRKEKLGFQPNTAFADAYPIHLLNLASHRDVAARCAYAIPKLSIRRFRANIIIQGPSAFAEDHWRRLEIGSVEIHAACRTVRCKLPNVDPATGERHQVEPDRTLKAYRRIDDGDRTNACLGMQLVPAQPEFQMRVGDEVCVLETGEHRYIKMLAPGEKAEGV